MQKSRCDDPKNQIQENDKIIQSYVEEDFPKPLEELRNLSMTELRDWHERRIAELQFLTEDINIDKIDQITKS